MRRFRHRHLRYSASNRHGRFARVVFLALMLVLSNAVSAWAMAMPFAADAGTANSDSHPCHETPGAAKHAPHGNPCPCCGQGCLCLHGSAASLPEFPVIRPLLLPARILVRNWSVPAAPPVAEHLRPPIA